MRKKQGFRWLGKVAVVAAALGLLLVPGMALADTATPTPTPTPAPPSVTLSTTYPVITGSSTDMFSFDVQISYRGAVSQSFNLSVAPPAGWTDTISSSSGKAAAAVSIGPSDQYGPATQTLTVNLTPPSNQSPDPGDYVATFSIDSGVLKQSIGLTARITARYGMSFTSQNGMLNTNATAGKETHFGVQVSNTGTAAINNVTFSSTKPDGWVVNFNPGKIDTLAAGSTQQIDVTIKPPQGQTIAGDYSINLSTSGDHGGGSINLRVTVLTPQIWGWVGIIIVLVVIAGLAVLFKVLGRR